MTQSKSPIDTDLTEEGAMQDSPLSLRLARRGVKPLGLINTRHPQYLVALNAQLIASHHPLLTDLMARYGMNQSSTVGQAGSDQVMTFASGGQIARLDKGLPDGFGLGNPSAWLGRNPSPNSAEPPVSRQPEVLRISREPPAGSAGVESTARPDGQTGRGSESPAVGLTPSPPGERQEWRHTQGDGMSTRQYSPANAIGQEIFASAATAFGNGANLANTADGKPKPPIAITDSQRHIPLQRRGNPSRAEASAVVVAALPLQSDAGSADGQTRTSPLTIVTPAALRRQHPVPPSSALPRVEGGDAKAVSMEVSDVGKGIPNLRLSTVKMPEETTGGFATAKVLPSASMANHGSMAADRESPGLLPAMKARRAFGKTHALQEDVMAVAAPPAMILRESATPDSEAASKPRAPDNRKAKADSPAAKSSLGAPTAETDKAAASLPATSGKGVQVDVQTIAEQVERIIARKLIVERERRGVQSWR